MRARPAPRHPWGGLAWILALALVASPPSPTAQAPATDTLRAPLQACLDAFVEARRVPGVNADVARVDGEALALAAGVSDRASERSLEPLELTGVVPAVARTVPGLVQGYAGARDPLGLPDAVLDAEGRFCIDAQFEWAGGGFATTGGDLARWARALFAGDVLDTPSRASADVEGRRHGAFWIL